MHPCIQLEKTNDLLEYVVIVPAQISAGAAHDDWDAVASQHELGRLSGVLRKLVR